MSETIICLACYGDRLASVFDNADEFRFYKVDGEEICPAGRLSLPSKDPLDRTSAILACGVNTLICGAVCRRTQQQFCNAGIAVRPWVRGGVEDVLDAFVQDTLGSLAMPGCRAVADGGAKPGMSCCRSGKGFGRQRAGAGGDLNKSNKGRRS